MNSAKQKGYRLERKIVELHKAAGIAAERMPLSGAAGGQFTGDIVIDNEWRGEIKARKNGDGFKVLEKWLGNQDLLFLRRDRQEPLIVMPWSTYVHMLRRDEDIPCECGQCD